MKVTVINEKEKKPSIWVTPILCFFLGIILCFFSNDLIIFLFRILGAFVFLYGFFPLTSYFQVVTGIWLFFIGLTKLSSALNWKSVKAPFFYSELIIAILFFVLGIYTIFYENVVFIWIGVLLIISSIIEVIEAIIKR